MKTILDIHQNVPCSYVALFSSRKQKVNNFKCYTLHMCHSYKNKAILFYCFVNCPCLQSVLIKHFEYVTISSCCNKECKALRGILGLPGASAAKKQVLIILCGKNTGCYLGMLCSKECFGWILYLCLLAQLFVV